MRYLPHTNDDIAEMLQLVGVDNLDDLFSTIPKDCLRKDSLNLPDPLTEWELNDHVENLAQSMACSSKYKVFIGAGKYDHYIPASASYLLGRSEFVTAYTPYQPEMAQGTLQAIFEYQTLVARLLGMEVSNASLYDGASGLAESLLMAVRITNKKKVAVSKLIHPMYRRVARTYLEPANIEFFEIPYLADGTTDISKIGSLDDLAGIAVQSPNFFGCIEDLEAFGKLTKDSKTLFITSFTEPLAYGLYKSPGSLGADIACGEGQSLGLPQSFGGPGYGMFACLKKHVRKMPGRVVGETKDIDGKRGFVLTLSTREQHIRREKATSNICTNSSLCALGSAIYMASLGKQGFTNLARLNYDKTEYLKKAFKQAGLKISFISPTFNEFVVEFPKNFKSKYKELIDKKILAGICLDSFYPEFENHYLVCVTETKTKQDLDKLVREVTS